MTEATLDLLAEIGLEAANTTQATSLLGNSRYLGDARINLKNALKCDNLSEKEALLVAVSVAANNKDAQLLDALQAKAIAAGASEAEVAEMVACASLLSANNILYRFRHFTGKEEYQHQPARLKMNIMMQPVTGKEFFELVSLAISAVNGCEMCVNAHEESVRQHGASEPRIFDAIRIASVVTSIGKLTY